MSGDSSSPSEVALAFLASFDTRDPDTIAAYVSDDFVNEHTAALGSSCVGREAYRERLPGFLGSMPDLHYTVESAVADGSEVAVFYVMTGRWQGTAPFEIRGAQLLEIVDREITRRTDYWDSVGFLLQVDTAAAASLRELGLG
jgi:predicted ester cyclase